MDRRGDRGSLVSSPTMARDHCRAAGNGLASAARSAMPTAGGNPVVHKELPKFSLASSHNKNACAPVRSGPLPNLLGGASRHVLPWRRPGVAYVAFTLRLQHHLPVGANEWPDRPPHENGGGDRPLPCAAPEGLDWRTQRSRVPPSRCLIAVGGCRCAGVPRPTRSWSCT